MDDQCELKSKIDEDGLTARLIVPESFDREQLTPALCQAMLMRAGIELASTSNQLTEQFIADAKAEPGLFYGVIARGTPPTHGQDGYIEWTLDGLGADKTNNPDDPESPGSDDGADATDPPTGENAQPTSFYERSVFTIVSTADVLGRVHHPVPGTDGRDVKGKNLAAREGKPVDFQHDESIMVARGNQIIAQADGVLDRSGKVICIRDTISVDQNVDFNTGNIRFSGNVIIQKGIRDCFKVDADGDVEVHGLIEAATIVTGGELRALGGFAGREQGKAQVGSNLKAKYLDAVESNVRGDLMVDREVINCSTTVLGRIDCPRGAIIGGDTLVAGSLEVAELGAEGMPMTTIQIGVVPHLDPLIGKLSMLVGKLIEQRQKLLTEHETIEQTSGKRVTSVHKERLCELMYEIAEVQAHLDRAEPSMQRACEKAESMRSVDVRVNKKVHPNTVLICSGLRYRIKNELKGPLRIFQDDKGQLKVERDGDSAAMLARQADLSEAA